jgi:hypothetical protein
MVSKMVKDIFVLRRNPVVVALTAIITGVYLREALLGSCAVLKYVYVKC